MVVLIFSEAAARSKQVQREVDIAFEKDQFILPFIIQHAPPRGVFEYCISQRHWLDATVPPHEPHYQRLVKAVHRILQTAPPRR
jgi:hypothetical protein